MTKFSNGTFNKKKKERAPDKNFSHLQHPTTTNPTVRQSTTDAF